MSLIRKEIEPVDMQKDRCFSCIGCIYSEYSHFVNGNFCDISHTEEECDEFDTEGKIIKSYIWVEDGIN